MEMEMHACVARGAALLDEKREGWHEQIDVERLHMMSTWDCLLGQLYDGFGQGVRELFPNGRTTRHDRAIEHGFDTRDDYDELEELWAEQIERRS